MGRKKETRHTLKVDVVGENTKRRRLMVEAVNRGKSRTPTAEEEHLRQWGPVGGTPAPVGLF